MSLEKEIKKNIEIVSQEKQLLLDFIENNVLGIPEDNNELLFKISALAEQNANIARTLPIALLGPKEEVKQEIIDNVLLANDIKVSYLGPNCFYVKIPALLPKKEHGGSSYIRSSVQMALENFFKTNERIRFEPRSTIIFKHNYARAERELRDHDNIEINTVVDVIVSYVLIDDNPLLLRHFYFSTQANQDSTEIFVIPNSQFIKFLQAQEVV